MVSATNENTIRRRRERLEQDRKIDETIIQTLMKDQRGRRWIWLRLEQTAIFSEDLEFDPGWMAYRKGLRNEGLRLLYSAQRYAPAHYVEMLKENLGVQQEPDQEEDDDRLDPRD